MHGFSAVSSCCASVLPGRSETSEAGKEKAAGELHQGPRNECWKLVDFVTETKVNRFIASTMCLLAAAATLLASNQTLAQNNFDLDIQNFRPSMDSRSFITVERSRILGTLEPTIGFYTSYAWNPLNQKIDGRDEVLVESLVSGQFLLTLGFSTYSR